jgi:hypothetical protein
MRSIAELAVEIYHSARASARHPNQLTARRVSSIVEINDERHSQMDVCVFCSNPYPRSWQS